MARRRQARETSHQPKGTKRPRAYHHGRSQGKVNEKKIKRALPAFERAEANEAEVSAHAAVIREEVSDWQSLLDGIVHVGSVGYAPFQRSGETGSRRAHNAKTAGSTPASAIGELA